MAEVYLGLGTNIGDRTENLNKAIQIIEQRIGRIQSLSSFYETKPWGYISGNLYLNAAICLETNILPPQLLIVVQQIEHEMGRERDLTKRYEDRIIDIDILFYSDTIYSDKNHTLTIPHPLIEKRKFVLEPLNEIAPDFIHPKSKKTVSQIFNDFLKEEKEKNHPRSLRMRIKSFQNAINGLKILLKNEYNARIHLVASILVIITGVLFRISLTEWMLIIFAIGIVFMCEIFNTVAEYLVDYVSPSYHNGIKKIKDLSAAAVLVTALTSVVIGLIIFLPKIIALF